MNAVIYFSPTGNTQLIANYAANYLDVPQIDLTNLSSQNNFDYNEKFNYLVICFPIYSQNIPIFVKKTLKKLKANYILLLATYGKMGTGNVLLEASKITQGTVIGGAYIPTKHTYKSEMSISDYNKLNSLLDRVNDQETKEISFPKTTKNIFANFFPKLRSQLGIKITKNINCCSCGICDNLCPVGTIKNGKINRKCLRCLRCVTNCPYQALNIKYSLFLKTYLKHDKKIDLIIY